MYEITLEKVSGEASPKNHYYISECFQISWQFHTVSGGIHLSCLELLDMKHCVPTPLIGLIFSSWATFRSKEEALLLSILMDSFICNEALYKEIKLKDKRLKGKKVLENEKQFLLRQKNI